MIYDIFFTACKWNFSCDCLLFTLSAVLLSHALPDEGAFVHCHHAVPELRWPPDFNDFPADALIAYNLQPRSLQQTAGDTDRWHTHIYNVS